MAESRANQLMAATISVQTSDSKFDDLMSHLPTDAWGSEAAETASIASTTSAETLTAPLQGLSDASASGIHTDGPSSPATTLQEQLALARQEVDEMKAQMERYRWRAEAAEEEKGGLAEMVARIRAESQLSGKLSSRASSATTSSRGSSASSPAGSPARMKKPRTATGSESEAGTNPVAAVPDDTTNDGLDSSVLNGSAHANEKSESGALLGKERSDLAAAEDALRQVRLLQSAVASALERADSESLARAAPYASLVGVVLLGVGIMAFLNGWQKAER